MIPRKRLDIGWTDILFGMGCCFWPGSRDAAQKRIGEFWSSSSDTVVSLAERSGFDLVLEALNLPRGSEILMSALNIRSMFDVIERFRMTGPSRGQVADARLALARDEEVNSRDNRYLLNQIARRYQYGDDVSDVFNMSRYYDQLNTNAIREAAAAYLDLSRYVKVTLRPEAQ